MTPTPSAPHKCSPPELDDDDVVITGLSGLFPTCKSVKVFSEKLYQNENLVRNDRLRWDYEHPELTSYCGTVPNLDTFDAQFFMVHYHLACNMDCMSRKLLEHAYQAVFDAGISPIELSGSKLGVFIATHLTETEKVSAYTAFGFGIAGCNRAMFSNRISYLLNAKGPSMTIDAACSGSMVCLEKAYEAMMRGDCDTAIVGGCHVHLHPQSCIHYERFFRVNPDGKTKCFDKNADGHSPSECISVIFLQKAKHAKRIYATVCKVKTAFSLDLSESGHFEYYGPYRDSSKLSTFYSEFYRESNISTLDVEYVEAFGSAFPEADKAELEAIQEVFCKNRKDPLYVGSVMSNMGFSQASSALAAITKMCLAYQTGKIPANLHYETPNTEVPAICDGRIRVVTENKPFNRSYTALNSLSLCGINGHLLLKGCYVAKNSKQYESKIPYLLAVSGRQESSVKMIFDDVKSHPIDPEEMALFHNIHKTQVTKHLARGFTILTTNENNKTVCLKEKMDYYDDATRPLWLVYSGMGSQWNGMGKELMRVPVFAAAIQRCHEVLKHKGIDLIHILTSDDKEIFENILNSFVGIAAVQIGLTDILLDMGLVPDNIIGHSVGELACAYADGCLTAEEVILAAYYRGLVSIETPMIKGSMAAVGVGWKQIQTICPHAIEVACHNSADSSTISGPTDALHDFVEKLTKQGVFAKEVNCSNIAYHSRYIKDAGPALLTHLKTVIKNPKPRSKKWLSTSVPKDRWEEPTAQMCSAEYHTNNLLNPVLFEETCEAIPTNAVLIEVAPHGLLQAILRRAVPPTCSNIPLTRRGHVDNAQFLLEAIGELYMTGYSPDLSVLYPKVKFPVSTETRSLSHLVEWVHTERWKLPVYVATDKQYAASYDITLSTHDDEFSFLRGHIIDDQTVFPFAGALVFVWDTLAMLSGVTRRELSVRFRDVHLHTQPPLFHNCLMNISVEIHKGNGQFQVMSENIIIATGIIEAATEEVTGDGNKMYEERSLEKMVYNSKDVYRMLNDRGYGYRGEFRSIQNENANKTCAQISWKDNWVTFIDAAIQMNILRRERDVVEQPRFVQRLYINVEKHNFAKHTLKDRVSHLEAYYYEDKRAIRCGGVVLENVLFADVPSRKKTVIALKTLQFVPYFRKDAVDVSTALYTMLQIMEENTGSTMKLLELTEKENVSLLSDKIKELLPELSNIKLTMNKISTRDIYESRKEVLASDLIIIGNLLTEKHVYSQLSHVLPPEMFILGLEQGSVSQPLYKYKVVASAITPVGRLVLGRWKPQHPSDNHTVIPVTSSQDIPKLKDTRKNLQPNGSLYILSQYPPIDELKSLVSQWRKEKNKNKVYLAMVDKTSIKNMDAKQLPDFDLAYCVLHNGEWGGNYFTRGSIAKEKQQREVALKSEEIGNLNSLHWTEIPEINTKDISVTVHYAGLNFYDAKKATGDILASPEEPYGQRYGMDFSGVTPRGERVMGVVRGGAAASKVVAQATLLWPVPEYWTLEDAATVPLAYAHAFYCLGIKCKLNPGMSVLVHGGAGALGQAAISIALANRCTIFTTVGDIKKKRFLMDIFPKLNADHIGCSRNLSFGDMVMKETNGVGCDIILSCVKGELKNVTLSCCAASGTTIDTQEVHSKERYVYGMYNMTKCRSYIALDFSSVFAPHNSAEMEQLRLMVSEGIARGYVRPLSRVVYEAHEAVRGHKLLAASRHRGKVLLHIHGKSPPATNRLVVQPKGSSLVIAAAADEALAIRIVDMLNARGAMKIVLHQLEDEESNPNMCLNDKMKLWQGLGTDVIKSFGALHSMAKVEKLIKDCNNLGLLNGIYVVADTAGKTAEETLTYVLACLDNVTRKTCSAIKYFSLINNNADIGRNIFINRALDKQPALVLGVPNIVKFSDTEDNVTEISTQTDSISHRRLIPYLESALCFSAPVAVVQTSAIEENLLEKVSSITRSSTGLELLYSNGENDELLAGSELIFLPTPSQKSTKSEDEFDCNASYLVLVPGMDGHYGKFESICKRLKLSAVVCQPGFDHPHENIPQMAERLVKVVLKRIPPKEKFYLMGYSFGVLVALEMAAVLEKHGLNGIVFCVDASPDTFPSTLDTWLNEAGATDDAKLQNAVVQHICSLMVGTSSDGLASELDGCNSWDERVTAGMRVLKEGGRSMHYARSLMETAYARIVQTRQYNNKQLKPLRSQLVLLRCQSNTTPSLDLGLSQYSQQQPHVYNLIADHANALEDLRCANIVNRHLDKSILDYFHKKNLCNTYVNNDVSYTLTVD